MPKNALRPLNPIPNKHLNQPWHPQQEMIARVLPNCDGEHWVMRRRTQAEMDELVASVGFRKIDTPIDNEGTHNVSLVQKDNMG